MVKETRENRGLFFTKRRRVCDNGHRFTTYEVHSPIFVHAKRRLALSVTVWNKRVERYARDLRVWIDHTHRGKTPTVLAKEIGLTRSAVEFLLKRIDKDRKGPNAP